MTSVVVEAASSAGEGWAPERVARFTPQVGTDEYCLPELALFAYLLVGRTALSTIPRLEMSMRTLSRCLPALALISAVAMPAGAQKETTSKLTWASAPPFLPAGARMAVVSGDPTKAGSYVLQLEMPGGYIIPAHQHPTDEHLLVKSGAFRIGMGDAFDSTKMKVLKKGQNATAPAKMNHFARASGLTVVEVSGTGPFAITYVATGNATPPKTK